MLETIKKLHNLPVGVWYSIKTKNGEDLTELIKELIDNRENFVISNDYKRFKKLENHFI